MSTEEHFSSRKSVYIKEAQSGFERYTKLFRFTHSTTKAAAIMLIAAVVAIVVANSPAYGPFLHFWHTEVGIVVGGHEVTMSLAHIINDILMAIFFLLVGLEIKYEMTVGELTNIRQAALPIMAAFGGVLMPIVIYSIFNAGNPETSHGWGVPTATDIAFALGILALLGNRVPSGVRVFLSTLAVADDIIAIVVIAVFYGQSPSAIWLGAAAAVFAVLIIMNRSKAVPLPAFLLVGAVLWFCVFKSGVHATIAGVLLAFAIPSGSRVNLREFASWSGARMRRAAEIFDEGKPLIEQKGYIAEVGSLSTVARQVVPPATRLEHKLYPWVYFAILPLFALTNADVSLTGADLGQLAANPALLGVFFGLLVGKPVGIMLMSFIVVKLKIAKLPDNVNWMHMLGAGILGGVGFTMAIFVANLAFESEALITTAKLGILAASALSGIIGFAFLMVQAKADQKRGIAYLTVNPESAAPQRADAEAARQAEELLQEIESPLLDAEIEAAQQSSDVPVEIVVELGEDGRRSDL